MSRFRVIPTFLILALSVLLWVGFASAEVPTAPQEIFIADLTGDQEVPPVDTIASGTATFVLDSDGTTLHYRLQVSNIGSVTGAHIHEAPVGSGGGVIFPLNSTGLAPDNPTSGSVTLNASQLGTLQAGNYYVNIHTSANGGGEIRGQIGANTVTTVGAMLSADQEVTPVDSPATGVARFTQTTVGTWAYEIAINSSDPITVTGGHLHRGAAGVPGDVAFGVNVSGLTPANSTSGNATFSSSTDLLDFLTGFLYVNLHTNDFGGGEMRGQTNPTAIKLYSADLTGDQEVPSVPTMASGSAFFALNDNWDAAEYTVQVSDIMSVTAAHVHENLAGSNGDVVQELSGAFDADSPLDGTMSLDILKLADLVASRFYVNVHTSGNPGGEIRGQLGVYSFTNLQIPLSGQQEAPPVETTATGSFDFSFIDTTTVSYTLNVENLPNATMAHIHDGLAGVTGGVIFSLYSANRVPDATLATGTLELSADQVSKFLNDFYYVNVHSSNNPGGELRGQISIDPQIPTAIMLANSTVQANSSAWVVLLLLVTMATTTATITMQRKR